MPAVRADLVVEVTPAKIERRVFDPRSPPSEMPSLRPPEVGQCVYRFSCDMEARLTRAANARPPVLATVTGVRIVTRLEITIWLPENGSRVIAEHEEGHRQICEYYYRNARAVASELGERLLRRVISLPATDRATVQATVHGVQDPLIAEFMAATMERCHVAQQRFDAITEHSIRPVDVREAVIQSIAEESRSHAAAPPGHRERLPPRRPSS